MLKIRIEGLPAEVEAFASELENLRHWEILQESIDYPNRGTSKLVRRYVDIEHGEEV